MKMIKRSIVSFMLALVMIAMPIGDTYTLTPIYAETTVYVTPTGSKYHTHKCGRGNYYASTLSSALARGLTACKKCFGNSGGYRSSSSSSSSSSKATKHNAPKAAPFKLKTTSVFLLKGKSKTIGTKNATGKVKWTSNKKAVATVSSSGKITAKGAGKATITATCGGKSVKCKVTVENPSITATSLTLKMGDEKKLTLKGCKHEVTWYTSDYEVCDVDGDKVYAGEPGKATIKAKVHGKTYVCKVVVEKPKVDDFTLSQTQMNLSTSDWSLQSIYIEDVDEDLLDYYSVSAESSNPDVVEILWTEDNEIAFEVVGAGEADITVAFGGKTHSCHISVSDEILTENYNE